MIIEYGDIGLATPLKHNLVGSYVVVYLLVYHLKSLTQYSLSVEFA